MSKNNQRPIKSFTDLKAWQESHKLVVMIYETTKDFPQDQLYSLVNQMQRSAVSITSNIAEGFGRETPKERTHFYSLARGSLTELQNQLLVSRDANYLSKDIFTKIATQSRLSHKLVNGLVQANKKKHS